MGSNISLINGILYEIAIAIGNSSELSVMLRESVTSIMRKLDGISVAVIDKNQQVLIKNPRRGFKNSYLEPLSAHDFFTCEKFVITEKVDETKFCYYFRLPQTGVLVFVTGEPLDPLLLKALEPICHKLDSSIQACLISEALQQKEQELSQSLVDLKRAQQTKDRFLANMSHEIRTPLNGVVGFVEQLNQTELDSQQAEFVNIIQKSSDTLLGIINDVLDFSKIESGQVELDLHKTHLQEELFPAIEVFKCRASEKNLLLNANFVGDFSKTLMADSLRLKQVISNLISNAIKFTQQGQVDFKAEVIEGDADTVTIEFSVSDSGVGISSENISKIFNAFSQAEKSTAREYGGTGLGLTICKELVKLMGGELKIQSELNHGSRFYFSLDFAIDETGLEVDEKPNWQFDASNKLVLLVEDNKVNQLLMKAVLTKLKVNYELAEDGVEALEKCKNQHFDLVLMDINMPIMGGVEAFHKLQELIQSGTIPDTSVVALTANALAGDRQNYMQMGMRDCLTKPLDMEELKRVFATLL